MSRRVSRDRDRETKGRVRATRMPRVKGINVRHVPGRLDFVCPCLRREVKYRVDRRMGALGSFELTAHEGASCESLVY